MKAYSKVLCIAGSECLGSSGVQADIKAVSACGAFAAGALTCIVNMDTTRVKEVFPLPEELVIGSVRSFLDDPGASAIKLGMLYTRTLIEKLADVLRDYPRIPKVVDPVMVASSGDRLIEWEAIEAYKRELFPLATLITPNYREACLLLGREFGSDSVEKDMDELCSRGSAAIVKSFHDGAVFEDVFSVGKGTGIRKFAKEFVETKNVNGTGCSFSSAIAAFLSRGYALESAVEQAEAYMAGAIGKGAEYAFGAGFGPVCHFWEEEE